MKLSYVEALTAENNLPPGPYEIKGFLEAPLSRSEIGMLKARLIDSGVNLISVSQSGSVLRIKAIKPGVTRDGISFLPALAITPFIAAVAIISGLAITAYVIHELPRVLDAMVPIAVIITIGFVLSKSRK